MVKRKEESKEKKIVVLGVGNILLKDEGFGVHVVKELKKMKLPKNVEVLNGGVLGPNLLGYIEDLEKLIVVDVVNVNAKPGTIFRIKPEQIRTNSQKYISSFHQIGVIEAIDIAESLGKKFETIIFALQPETIGMGMELSKKLEEKMPEILKIILDEIKK